jgi:ribosomal protein L7/L12
MARHSQSLRKTPPMKSISISGWNVGFRKLEHTRLLRSEFGLSLSQAKQTTDEVLAGNAVTLQVPDDRYEQAVAELIKLGAKVDADTRFDA